MAFSSFDGTTSNAYTIGDVNGITFFHDTNDPSLSYPVKPGDLWFNNSNPDNDILVRNNSNTAWTHISIANISLDIINYPTFIINVSKNGDDVLGDGKIQSPFLTVEKALSHVDVLKAGLVSMFGCNVGAGSVLANESKFLIIVHPGVYEENNPLNAKQNTFIQAYDPELSEICASNVSLDLFNVPSDVEVLGIKNISLSNSEKHVFVLNNSTAKAFLSNVRIACNLGIDIIEGTLDIDDVRDPKTDVVSLIKNTGGIINSKSLSFETDNYIGSVLSTAGTSQTIISDFNITGFNIAKVVDAGDNSVVKISNGTISQVSTAITCAGFSEVSFSSVFVSDTITSDLVVTSLDASINIFGGKIDLHKVSVPVGYNNEKMFFYDNSDDSGRFMVLGKLNVGQGNKGYVSNFGRGESYTTGLNVLVTDDDSTSTTEGSNIIDVSNILINRTGSTSFKGVTSGHTMLVGSELDDHLTLDKVKFWGIKINLTQAAQLNVKDSFIFEFWDGVSWVEKNTFSFSDVEHYRYSKNNFIRSGSEENIIFGINQSFGWQKKTILGKNLYWCRIRISNDILQLPEFDMVELIPSSVRINNEGKMTLFGESRHRGSVFSAGNVFGESGGITNGNVDLGITNWIHRIKGSTLNYNNDAIYTQFTIPFGTDTSMPFSIRLYLHPDSDIASTDVELFVDVLPLEVSGNRIADVVDSKIPVPRSSVNAADFDASVKQSFNVVIDSSNSDVIQVITIDGIDISHIYEGDFLALRVGLGDDSDQDKNIQVWGIEVLGFKWTFGTDL